MFTAYCCKKNENLLELIDGQQRLTTIFLILKVIKSYLPSVEPKFCLSYEVRTRSEQYLNNISDDSLEDNIDFYFIKKAYLSIKDWFNKQSDPMLAAINFYKKYRKKLMLYGMRLIVKKMAIRFSKD